ncbi:hypothetical protein ACWDR9_31880 [Streptosporangium sandarakinum]
MHRQLLTFEQHSQPGLFKDDGDDLAAVHLPYLDLAAGHHERAVARHHPLHLGDMADEGAVDEDQEQADETARCRLPRGAELVDALPKESVLPGYPRDMSKDKPTPWDEARCSGRCHQGQSSSA